MARISKTKREAIIKDYPFFPNPDLSVIYGQTHFGYYAKTYGLRKDEDFLRDVYAPAMKWLMTRYPTLKSVEIISTFSITKEKLIEYAEKYKASGGEESPQEATDQTDLLKQCQMERDYEERLFVLAQNHFFQAVGIIRKLGAVEKATTIRTQYGMKLKALTKEGVEAINNGKKPKLDKAVEEAVNAKPEVETCIKILKKAGYKVMRPVTEYKEV